MKRLRIWFWNFVHEKSERLWHWSYYHRVLPLAGGSPPFSKRIGTYNYTYVYRNAKGEVSDPNPKSDCCE